MNKEKKIRVGIVVAVLIMTMVLGVFVRTRADIAHMTYTTFLQNVEENKVESVEMGSSSQMKVKLVGDEKLYETDHPRTQDLKEQLLLKNIKVQENYQTTGSASGLQYMMSSLMFFAMAAFIFNMVKKRGPGGSGMQMQVKPIEPEQLKVDFNHIAGNEEAKEQVQDVIDFMKDPEKYNSMGARMPKGLIFYGPPGTGKTLMAKAMAKEANVAFFSASGSDFVQMYVGVGASRVRNIFKEARKYEKAVIFIDEIDAIGKKRSPNGMNSNDEKDQTLNALLTEMSGFKDDEGIIVVAATNRLDMLDDALLRPGRFDRHIEIGYPDFAAREQIIKLHLKNKPLSEEVEVETLAKQTVYFTGAMLENLLNEAAILAANRNQKIIDAKAIDDAFYIVIAGKEKKDRSGITEKDRKVTAFHEAGHALVTKLIAPEHSVTKVTIIPSTKGAGGFSMNIPKDKMYLSKEDLLNSIKISLAGRVAEELIFGKDAITTGASNDIEKASDTLKNYMVKYGMDEDYGLINLEVITGSSHMNYKELTTKCATKMKMLYEETKMLMKENENILHAIAEGLLDRETLNETEIASFF